MPSASSNDPPLGHSKPLSKACGGQGPGTWRSTAEGPIGRTLSAAAIVGIRALAVIANDGRAQGVYAHVCCQPTPSDPQTLVVLLENLEALNGKESAEQWAWASLE